MPDLERHGPDQDARVAAFRRPPPPADPVAPGRAPARPPPTAPPPADRPAGLALRRWRPTALRADLYWVGAHGGAGESTLEAALERTVETGHRWPDPNPVGPPARAILVARTSWMGLEAAQAALRQYAEGRAGNCRLLGLLLSADAPGKRPKELQQFLLRVAGGAPLDDWQRPVAWELPWIDAWRLRRTGEPPLITPPVDAVLKRVLKRLYSIS